MPLRWHCIPVRMIRIFDIADRLRLSERFHGAARSVLARV